jgi:hypothetical protein
MRRRTLGISAHHHSPRLMKQDGETSLLVIIKQEKARFGARKFRRAGLHHDVEFTGWPQRQFDDVCTVHVTVHVW